MVGDTIVSEGQEFIVVWDGGEGLIADRPSKVSDTWAAPKRIYNKTGNHSVKQQKQKALDLLTSLDTSELTEDTDMEEFD